MSADRLRPLAALVLLGTLLASGCSDAFDPFLESEEAFALFGFLDAERDTQFVRVQPIDERDTNRVEARVTSAALATGQQIAWRDSLVRLDDGTTGTVYFAAFRPEPGMAYRIEAVPSDAAGGGSVAEVRVPAEAELRIEAPDVVGEIVAQVLGLESVLRPRDARVTYTVRRPGGEPIALGFDYTAHPASSSGGFEVLVNLQRDAGAVQALLDADEDGAKRLALLDLRLAYDLVDERGGVVTGGPGAFGAAARFDVGWTLAPGVVETLGFEDAQDEG